MKRLVASTLMLASAVAAYSQGQIVFNNRVLSSTLGTVNAPIYGPDPAQPFAHFNGPHATNGGTIDYRGPLLAGTGFTAALYGGPVGGALSTDPISTATFRTAVTLLGNLTPPNPAAPALGSVAPGSFASFEMRVWENRGGLVQNWAAVMADPTIARGQSGVFSPPFALGGTPPGGGVPVTPPNLAGLTSFNIAPVPEPGVIALGVLGLGALLLRRRK